MIVSLAAIFLSTFVLISQNRADAKRRSWPTTQRRTIEQEERQNQQLLNLSNQIWSSPRPSTP
jgi:uncharacterized membrane protein